MDATEAALLAREHLNDVHDINPDMGFETTDITQFDFKEWAIECRVFSASNGGMVDYLVIISDDKVQTAREIDATDSFEVGEPREQYIEEHLQAIRDRQAAELVKSRQYFGEEYDQEHSNE